MSLFGLVMLVMAFVYAASSLVLFAQGARLAGAVTSDDPKTIDNKRHIRRLCREIPDYANRAVERFNTYEGQVLKINLGMEDAARSAAAMRAETRERLAMLTQRGITVDRFGVAFGMFFNATIKRDLDRVVVRG